MTQKTQLIHYMRLGFITPLDALRLCECYRFSARIHEIRKMYDLEPMKVITRHASKGKREKWTMAFKIKGTK